MGLLSLGVLVTPYQTNAQVVLGVPGQAVKAPYNLKVIQSGNSPLLFWNFGSYTSSAPDAPDTTLIYRSEDNDQNFKQILRAPAVMAIFTDGTAAPGKTYYYKVAYTRRVPSSVPGAPPSEVKSTDSNVVNITTLNVTPLPKVTVSVQSTSYGALSVNWNPYPGAMNYMVYRKKEGDRLFDFVGTINGTNFIDTSVSEGSFYVYYVVPRTIAGLAPSSDLSESVGPTRIALDSSDALATSAITDFSLAQTGRELYQDRKDGIPVKSITVNYAGSKSYDKTDIYRSSDKTFYSLVASYNNVGVLIKSSQGSESRMRSAQNDQEGYVKFVDEGLKPDTEYWYRVVGSKNDRSVPLSLAPEKSIKTDRFDATYSEPKNSEPITFNVFGSDLQIFRGQTLKVDYSYKNLSNQDQRDVLMVRELVDPFGNVIARDEIRPRNQSGSTQVNFVPKGMEMPFSYSQFISPARGTGTWNLRVTITGIWGSTGTGIKADNPVGVKFTFLKELRLTVK